MAEEKKAVAGTQEAEFLDPRLLPQERERRKGRGFTQRVDEAPVDNAIRAHAAGIAAAALRLIVAVEDAEALEGLGEPVAAEAVGDEVAPGPGDALEPAEGFGGEAGEDLHQGIVGQGGRRGRAPLGVVHAAANGQEE